MDRYAPKASRQLEILTRDNLLERPQLLQDIVALANTTYLDHKLFNQQLRFEDDRQLPSELGDDGLCAVMLEITANPTKPVAVACTKPCIKLRTDELDSGGKVRRSAMTHANP